MPRDTAHNPRRVFCGALKRGSSVLQTTISISALAVIAGVTAPAVQRYMTHAKVLRANREVRTLASAMVLFLADLRFSRNVPPSPGRGRLKLMVSRGRVPRASEDTDSPWLRPLDDPGVASFDDYLMTNGCGFPELNPGSAAVGWGGPYLNVPVPADPWGNRYACNIGVLAGGFVPVILSAGPDGEVSLPYYLNLSDTNRETDDVFFVLQ